MIFRTKNNFAGRRFAAAAAAALLLVLVLPAMLAGEAVTFAAGTEEAEGEKTPEPGWHTTKNGKYYYYILKDGTRAKGWKKIGSRTYFFNKKGYRVTGFREIDGKLYYFGPKGVLRRGWITVNGKKYYADPGNWRALAKGLTTIGNYTYFFKKKTGEMRTSCWLRLKGERYYF